MNQKSILAGTFSGPWYRIHLITFGLIFGVGVLGFLGMNYSEWSVQKDRYQAWSNSTQPGQCQQIKAECAVNRIPEPSNLESFKEEFQYFLAEEARRNGCEKPAISERYIECDVSSPGTFFQALSQGATNYYFFPRLFIGWLAVAGIALAGRALYQEPHKGWQRISILIAPATGYAAFWLAYSPWSSNREEAVLAGYVAFLVGLVGPMGGRKVLQWVQDGFIQHAVPSSPTVADPLEVVVDSGESAVATPSVDDSSPPTPALVEPQESVEELQRNRYLGYPPADFSRRVFARWFDISFFTYPAVAVVAVICYAIERELPESKVIQIMVTLPVILFLDAGCAALFGNTPGKAILAIHVRNFRGNRLSFTDYLVRNFKLYVYGLALGFPIFGFFTAMRQIYLFNKQATTSYDAGIFNVRVSDLGTGRKMLMFIVFFVMLAIRGLT